MLPTLESTLLAPPPVSPPPAVRRSEVISALSYALDLTEGQPEGHSVRSCIVGMRLADELALADADRADLFYALLLKDAGCSANAAAAARLFGADDFRVKRSWKLVDWASRWESLLHVARNAAPGASLPRRLRKVAGFASAAGAGTEMVRTRCERGADIAHSLGHSDATAGAIRALDEHWDGRGAPYGLRADEIPLLGRVLCLAQTVEIFGCAYGAVAAFEVARERAGRWFDPALVRALGAFAHDDAFWTRLYTADPASQIDALAPAEAPMPADDAELDRIVDAFARVIDAKSPYTFHHSTGVAEISLAIAAVLDFEPDAVRDLRRAAMLHDVGKLGVSNRILDKPGRLTPQEMAQVRRHPEHTQRILERVPAFRALAEVAASHHERLDGNGYHRGLPAELISLPARVIAVADVFEALSAKRPYREALPRDRVLNIMQIQVGPGLCPLAFDALLIALERGLVPDAPVAPHPEPPAS